MQQYLTQFKVPFGNILALSTDNTAVLVGNQNSFFTRLEKVFSLALKINCPSHSWNLVAQHARRCNSKMVSWIFYSIKREAKYTLCWHSPVAYVTDMVSKETVPKKKKVNLKIGTASCCIQDLFLRYILNIFNTFNAFFLFSKTRKWKDEMKKMKEN